MPSSTAEPPPPTQPQFRQTPEQPNTNLPLVLLHRLPQFGTSFMPRLQTHVRLFEPTDPSFPGLSQSVRVLLCLGPPQPVTPDTLDRYPSLELVVGSSAGIDHIDLLECRRRGIRVTNAGDAYSDDVADYAVALLIDVLRHVSAADRFVRAKLWPVKGEYPLGFKVGAKRVGIVGLGSIGTRIARRLEAFGCSIAYHSRKKKSNIIHPYYADVHDLAANSDALIVCCALTNETTHIINKDVMTALGKKGIIINVGRGALVDEKELVQLLVQGEIGGAGLDVYENEPSVPAELFALDNVVLSPHRAVATPESLKAVEEVVIGNLGAFFSNKPLLSEVKF